MPSLVVYDDIAQQKQKGSRFTANLLAACLRQFRNLTCLMETTSVFVGNNTVALADNADNAVRLMLGLENVRSLSKLALRKNYDITDTHVEDAIHFVAVDLALVLNKLEDRRNFPGGTVDLGVDGLGENARNVIRETAACDVGHARNLDLALKKLGDGLEEALMDGEKRLAESLIRTRELILPGILAEIENDAAGEREAVGLKAAGREADDDVSGADGLARDELALLHATDDGADEIVFAGGIKAGHLSRLAAEKSHLVLLAGLAETGDHVLELDGIDLGRADVVHEEERLRALNEDVVDAVVDDVLADSVVLVHHRGNLELGADTVSRRNEDHALACRNLVKTAECTDAADDVGGFCGSDHLLDGSYGIHLDININTGLGVCGLRLFCHGELSS